MKTRKSTVTRCASRWRVNGGSMPDTVQESRLNKIREIVADVLKVAAAEITDDLAMYRHPLWDSVAQLDIILALEVEFGVTIDDVIAPRLTTVAQIAEQ